MVGCSDGKSPSETTPPPPPPVVVPATPAAVTVVAGAGQSAAVDAVLPTRIAVRVDDASGKPISGVTVTFTATSGGPVIDGSTQTTDANGVATVGNVTLGPAPTTNAIVAKAGDVSSTSITATSTWVSRLITASKSACVIAPIGRVQCWGNASYGELGAPSSQFTGPPYLSPTPYASAALASITALGTTAGYGLCGTTSAGWSCWGHGFGLNVIQPTPVAVAFGMTWADVSEGYNNACGVTSDGAAYCWGLSQGGNLGNPSVAPLATATTPVPMVGRLTFKSVSTGWVHSCALSPDGTAYCWGTNGFGQLGNGSVDTVAHFTPVKVETSEKFVQLSSGGRYTCGVTTSQKAMCWGRNGSGQLGDGTTTDRAVPTAVAGGQSFVRISAGSAIATDTAHTGNGLASHTCAITTDGIAYCWGLNANGQLGDGTRVDRLLPTAISSVRAFNAIDAGDETSCAMRGNSVWCWGLNDVGQVGDGTSGNLRLVPTAVSIVP